MTLKAEKETMHAGNVARGMKPVKKGLVSIVILNWNGKKFLKDCIESISESTDYRNFEVIVADNGSTDGSIDLLQEMKKKGLVQKLVLNGRNLGFGGGNNRGIFEAEGEFVFLLNNDTKVTKGWLAPLVELANRRADAGIIGPLFPNLSQLDKIFGPGFIDNKGISRDLEVSGECEGEMVSGGAFFVKRKVIDAIGLLDEKFFPIYFEDSDYCARARKAGFRILFTPKSKIIHYESAATNAQPAKWKFLALNSNRVRYMLLHFPKRRLAKAAFWETLRLGKNALSRKGPWLLEAYWQNAMNAKEIAEKRRLYGSGGYAATGMQQERQENVLCVGGSGGLGEIEAEWQKLAAEKGNFFLEPAWIVPWAEGLEETGRASPWIVAAGEKGKVLGMAFFERKGKSVGFLGQDFSYHLGILAENGREKEAIEIILGFALADAGWDLLFFRHMAESQAFRETLERKCAERGLVAEFSQGDHCSVVELPGSMQAYWAGLKKKLRKNLRNDLSRLEREFRVEAEISSGTEAFEGRWKKFLELHFENIERKGEKTVLAEPWFQGVCKKACANAAEEGKLRFLSLKLGGVLAGMLLAVEEAGTFSVLNIGFAKDYGSRQSLGNVLFLKAIEYCCGRGIKKFDLLGGSPGYKAKFGARPESGLEIRVFRSRHAQEMDALKRKAKTRAKKILGRA
jgi:hypothetical protein